MPDDSLWRTKLSAWLHGLTERPLAAVPDRDNAREDGAAGRLRGTLFPVELPDEVRKRLHRADEWASAADLPRLPDDRRWAGIDWFGNPLLIHPLSGSECRWFSATQIADAEECGRVHFEKLIVRASGEAHAAVDWRRTLLAWWRFGSELEATSTTASDPLAALWRYLPADPRFPDQAIWDHLDLTSAFTGAFAADHDDEAALLALTIGPVQPFIAAARSTSDLWAGSHFLARLSWEAMRVVCEQLGPDAVLFPRLRGIPQVDLWLRDECGLPGKWFSQCDWVGEATDGNPLFAAALPNRFVAVVPASSAREIPQMIERHVRHWLQARGRDVVDKLLEVADPMKKDESRHNSVPAYAQMRDQLAGFPEVHWASAPFSLVQPCGGEARTDLDTTKLSAAMAPFFGARDGDESSFLQSGAWAVLRKEMRWNAGAECYVPSPGVLYPALYDLAERVLAAAKAVRPFEQTEQQGWRCSLTGETEWLTTDRGQLERPYRRQTATLWTRVARRRPAWARKGEHLGALPAIKRLWPTLFAREVGAALSTEGQAAAERFVVSTHTMALAAQIDRWLERDGNVSSDLQEALDILKPLPAALPRRIVRRHSESSSFRAARRLPGLLGIAREGGDEAERRRVDRVIRDALGLAGGIETYYALLMMDGDHMGRILSGDEKHAITYAESVHPAVRDTVREAAPGDIGTYLDLKRAMSANRHLAVSAVLNDFALRVVPRVIEGEHLGRVLYAGGDDVLAMLPVADLLHAMYRLRYAYSGDAPGDPAGSSRDDLMRPAGLFCTDGFASLDGRLMRMMGGATASCGAVIAHYMAPLAAVLRELRAAEKRAKDAGRDRFSLTVVKRSGGRVSLTAEWGEPLPLLADVAGFLREPCVSRRAVYHTLVWLRELPHDNKDMLASLIEYQFHRQTSDKGVRGRHDVPGLARRLAELAVKHDGQPVSTAGAPEAGRTARSYPGGRPRLSWLGSLLSVAEFIAREARSPSVGEDASGETTPSAAQVVAR